MTRDEQWMIRAIEIAERGRLSVSPNPMVGACVVKGNRLIAEGAHLEYGKRHAEVIALARAGRAAKGATLYITLEPCSSYGQTPPCTDLILKSKIKRVVIGLIDPNPKHKGKAVKIFRKAGLEVKKGVLAQQVKLQNEAFLKWIQSGLPFVTLKMAQTLDGKIAAKSAGPQWISGPVARKFVQELRAEQDAILVGKNTLLKDNPRLTLRGKKRKQLEKPWRIVLDPKDEVKDTANVLKGKQRTLRVISEKQLPKLKIKKRGAHYLVAKEKKGRLLTKPLLKELGAMGVSKLLVEGGGELAWDLISQRLVDKFYWIVAPKFLGGRDAVTSVEGEGAVVHARGQLCKIEHVHKLGDDFMFEGRLKK